MVLNKIVIIVVCETCQTFVINQIFLNSIILNLPSIFFQLFNLHAIVQKRSVNTRKDEYIHDF